MMHSLPNWAAHLKGPLKSLRESVASSVIQNPTVGVPSSEGSEAATTTVELPLEDYGIHVARVIDDAAREPTTRAFDNFGAGHAKTVLRLLLRRATKTISVYAHQLDADVWDATWLRDFLMRSPNGSISILVENPGVLTDPRSALYEAYDLLNDQRVSISVVPEDCWAEHVAIMDDWLVRVETSQVDKTASVAAGNSDLGRAARELFATLSPRSQPMSRISS